MKDWRRPRPPTLTIVALAIRQAEHIRDQMARQEI